MEQETNHFNENVNTNRRNFVKQGLIVTLSGAAGISLLSACNNKEEKEEGEEKEVSPPEDLMQEHGVLNRILLIYDTCKTHLINKTSFPNEALGTAANIIRTFVEDYHERQEENYLFPRFHKQIS